MFRMIPIERVVYVDNQPWLLTRLGDNDADLESFRQKWIRIPVERLTFTDFPCDPDHACVVGLKRDGSEIPTRKWGLVRVVDDSPNLVHIEADFAPYDFWVRLDDFESETQAVERAQKYRMAA